MHRHPRPAVARAPAGRAPVAHTPVAHTPDAHTPDASGTVDPAPPANPAWRNRIFAARAVDTGGVIRRAVRDVDREIGREALELEVRRRGFHLIECGGQFIILCNRGALRVVC